MLRLESMTPLGNPVVPEVYCMLITSSGPIAELRASSSSSETCDAATRRSSYGVKPGGV
jgi:hypothetical protein